MKKIRIISVLVICAAAIAAVTVTVLKDKPAEKKKDSDAPKEAVNKDDSSSEDAEDASRKKHSAVEDAQLKLMAEFVKNPDGSGYTYPDDYCGSYAEYDKFYIYLTSVDEESVAKYNDLFSVSPVFREDAIEYKQRAVPLNTMYAYAEDMCGEMIDAGCQVHGFRVNEKDGKIQIDVTSPFAEKAKECVSGFVDSGMYEGLKTTDVEIKVSGFVISDADDYGLTGEAVWKEYSNLQNSFTKDGHSAYPEDYCGCYEEDGKLHVIFTSPADEAKAAYDSAFDDPDIIVYEQGTINRAAVNEYLDDMVRQMLADGLTYYDCGYNEKTRQMEFVVPEGTAEATRELLESLISEGFYEGLGTSGLLVQAKERNN